MTMKILFKNGVFVTSSGKERADVLVKDGKIAEVGSDLSAAGWGENLEPLQIIDCSGQFLLPGVIDVHVHMRVPGAEHKEDWETGSAAAVGGGVTTVLDMPNTPVPTISRKFLEEKRALIAGKSRVNYGFYMGAVFDPETGQTNIDEYLASDAIAMKVYIGSTTGPLLVDQHDWLEEIFEKAAAADCLICVHAEDEALIRENTLKFEGENHPTVHPKIRDDEVAYRAARNALHLAKKYGTRLHICHMSTARELVEFKAFKSDRISCEVTPHHLFLTEEELSKQGNFAKMNPPLRTPEDNAALIEGIREGMVNMVATDHAPHLREEKEQPYSKAPAGVPGLEMMLPLLLNAVNQGELTLEDVVRVTSEEPARVFGLNGKGQLEVGADADLVLVDMDLEQTVENGGPGARYTKCGWSAFSGRKLKGWPVMTVVNGEIVLRDGQVFDSYGGHELGLAF